MPRSLDLAERRFGKLLVLRAGDQMLSASGKTKEKTWVCLCDCGREETIPDRRIPHCASNARRSDAVESCLYCRSQRICAACGTTFESAQFRACCSDICKVVHDRALYRERYYRLVDRDPTFNKKRADEIRARAQADPDFAAQRRAWEEKRQRKRNNRMRSDPEYRAQQQAQARAYYQSRSQEIQEGKRARRKARLAAMTDAEFEIWITRQREFWRNSANKLRATAAGHERYLETMRRHRQKQAMAGLTTVSESLMKRAKK